MPSPLTRLLNAISSVSGSPAFLLALEDHQSSYHSNFATDHEINSQASTIQTHTLEYENRTNVAHSETPYIEHSKHKIQFHRRNRDRKHEAHNSRMSSESHGKGLSDSSGELFPQERLGVRLWILGRGRYPFDQIVLLNMKQVNNIDETRYSIRQEKLGRNTHYVSYILYLGIYKCIILSGRDARKK